METGLCCVYNATRGCRLNSKVTVADSAREPLKVLKVLIEGLARDGESSLWLTPLVFTPNIMRLFPFDFAYLDSDLQVIEGLALPPGIPLPQFNARVASALILPFDTLSSTGTCAGDRLIVCVEEELEARIAEISAPAVVVRDVVLADTPIAATSPVLSELPKPTPHPYRSPKISLPSFAGLAAQGTSSTLAMSTSWQISTSTVAAVLAEPATAEQVLPDPVEVQQEEAASVKRAGPEIAVEESKIKELSEETAEIVPVPGTVLDQATEAAGAEPLELDAVPAQSPEPEAIAAEPETVEKNQETDEGTDPTEKSAENVSDFPGETASVIELVNVQVELPETRTETLTPQRIESTEDVPATIARDADPDPAKAKDTSREKKKKVSLGVLVKRFLNCEDPLPERRSIIRLLSKELVAYTANTEKTKPYEVRDVSPTGLYLHTDERWQPGHLVSLTLQRKDAKEEDLERRVSVQVRAVRGDEDGVGVSWAWPEGVEFHPWRRVHTKRSYETDADYFLRELRLTVALGFLRQICPPAVEEIKLALHQRLSNKRVASAVEIVLKAQKLFDETDHSGGALAHPDVVRRILENGSWTADDWIRHWWAGLLVSSCRSDGLDTSNSVFIDLLAKLTPAHLRVLRFVCLKESVLLADGESPAKLDIYCTAGELIEAVGSQSLSRIQQTMGQLSSLGLLAENNKPSYVAVTDKGKTRIEPTALALKMHARCNGRQG
jgi:hypothetical protein